MQQKEAGIVQTCPILKTNFKECNHRAPVLQWLTYIDTDYLLRHSSITSSIPTQIEDMYSHIKRTRGCRVLFTGTNLFGLICIRNARMDWKHKEFYKEKKLFTFKNVDNTCYLTCISSYDILYPQRYERYWILIL